MDWWCTDFCCILVIPPNLRWSEVFMNWFHPCEMEICSWNLWCSLSLSPRKPEQHGKPRWGIVKWMCFFLSFLWKAFSSLFSILLSIFALEIPHDFSFVPPFDGTWHVENGPAKAILALDSLELYWEGSACMLLRCFQAFTPVSRHLL